MKQVLFTVSLVIILAACQKEVEDQIATNSDCLLVRMVQGLNNSPLGDTTFEFIYNDTGRLEEITLKVDDFLTPLHLALTYDDDGRLIKVSAPIDPGGLLESRFTYDNDGRLLELFYQRFSYPSKIVYTYGSGNQPVSGAFYDFVNGQWEEAGTHKYTYANGNVVKTDVYMNNVFRWSDNFEYDLNLVNNTGVLPLVGFSGSIPLGYYEEFLFFNKNLPKKLSWNYGTDYVYEYVVADDQIIQSVGTYVHQGTPSQRDTRSFFYECK